MKNTINFWNEKESLNIEAELPLDVLKKDGEYPGFTIRHHADFMALINSFRRFNKLESPDDKVLVITLSGEER